MATFWEIAAHSADHMFSLYFDFFTRFGFEGRIWVLVASVPVLRILDTEANRFYDRNHQMYEAALLPRCYTQHALRPFIDAEINHQRHFIKIPFINKGMDFIDLPSILQD